MKKLSLGFVCLFLVCGLVQAQPAQDDPLAESYIIHNGGWDELITFGSYYPQFGISVHKYFKAPQPFARDTLIQMLLYDVPSTSDYDMDLYDLDNDKLQEIVGVWIANQQVEIVVLKADPARLKVDSTNAWSNTYRLSKSNPAVYTPQNWQVASGVFVKAGNFDADTLGEFVVAYWANDSMIELTLYDVSDSLTVTELASIRDQVISEPPVMRLCEDQVYLYDIECADFNNDGIDEILLSGRAANVPTGWQIFANLYAYNNAGGILEAQVHSPVYTETNANHDVGCFNTSSGNFFYPDSEQAVIGFLQYVPNRGQVADTLAYILIPFDVNDQLNALDIGATVYQWRDTVLNEPCYFRTSTLSACDVNDDGIDELLSAFSFEGELPTFKIYSCEQPLALSVWADLDNFKAEFQSIVVCGNLEHDTLDVYEAKELIIQSGSWYPGYITEIYKIQTDPDGSFDQLQLKYTGSELPMSKSEPWLVGDLDGDIRLGAPSRYSITSIVQPLVILNAPPIHFDVFDQQAYDVGLSYNQNQGQFVSTYYKESSQTTEVQTEFTQDWGTSHSLHAGGSFWGISVSAHLNTKYGKQFSKVAGSSTTVTVNISVDARVDDRIYATVVDYNLWEYPVYGNNQFRGHVLVVQPAVTENRWFPSKSWSGYSYIPNHEVGNILSYREYPLLTDNPDVAEKIKGDYNTSFVLDGNSSYDWSLMFADFASNQASTSKSYSREWGASVDVWGSGYSTNSTYSRDEISTHSTEVANGLQLNVHLDAIDVGLGEVGYLVTPYSYWADNGALVVDYAVRPELAPPGGTPTWWQVHYGDLADPAFILPWRYDPEKGEPLQDEAKRYMTKDLLFYPNNPRDGDIVLIRARIHNFSLISTPGPMGVRFYIGDPDSGGTLITSPGGISEVFTPEAIPARATQSLETYWQVPAGIGIFPRIYAVIDAGNTLPEIHENNNKSWAILNKTTTTGITPAESQRIPLSYHLSQNYPNPFNPQTKIDFSIPQATRVEIQVYNLLGQLVGRVFDKQMPAGNHSFDFDGSVLPSGMYFYQIQAGKFIDTKKMVLLK